MLSWSASADNVGVTAYEVSVNSVSHAIITATSATITGLLAATGHSVNVRARDAAGNWSTPSGTIVVTTLADSEPPSVPTGLVASAMTGEGFTIAWNQSTDDSGSVVYEVFLDGASQGIVATTTKIFAGLQPLTSYSVTVRAGDSSGNWSLESGALVVETLVGAPENYSISAGLNTVAFARGDGTVWSWGRSIGLAPIRIDPITTAVSVAASDSTILILQENGTVLAKENVGGNQASDGTTTTPISNLTGVTGVALGLYHSLAVKADGTVYGWGSNGFGQVGAGKVGVNVGPPTKIKQLSGIIRVTAGQEFSLALKSNGTVLAWGLNSDGQLGDGTTTNRSSPVVVSGLTGVIALAGGAGHSLALMSDGTVWAWGANGSGQIGDGTTVARTTPVLVAGLTGVVAITAGAEHSLALKADGSLWAWGSNIYAQLGDGSTVDRRLATPVTLVGGVRGCVASGYATFAVLADGTIRSWGGRFQSKLGVTARDVLGDGSSSIATIPYDDVEQIEGSVNDHLLVRRRDGSVWAWGLNGAGQLGDGTLRERLWPRRISGLDGITEVSRGIALQTDGRVLTWGRNSRGQLGDGTVTDRFTPDLVPGLTGVVQVAAGSEHRMALKSNGTVWVWGSNDQGQVGDGTNVDRWSPIQVPTLSNITSIAAGGRNSFAVRSDGTVWSWGYDWWASGTNTGKPEPVPLQAFVSGVTRVSTSGQTTLFLTNSGNVFACGSANVGVGPWYGTAIPLQIPELSGIVEVSAAHGSVARNASGDVWRWGSAVTQVEGISNPEGLRSASGLGLVYTDGTSVLWVEPTVPPAGFDQLAGR